MNLQSQQNKLSGMHLLNTIAVACLVGASFDILLASKASAQSADSFSQCISNLDNLPGVHVDTAISQCQSIYSSQLVNEPFSNCVTNLDRLPGVHVDTAISACKSVFVGDYVGENFSNCVTNLDRLPGVHVDTAIQECTDVSTNANGVYPSPQANNSPSNYPFVIQYPQSGSNPEAVAQCMQTLLYERRPVCTYNHFVCSQIGSPAENANEGLGGWQWESVRTETSESAAVQACQNAR